MRPPPLRLLHVAPRRRHVGVCQRRSGHAPLSVFLDIYQASSRANTKKAPPASTPTSSTPTPSAAPSREPPEGDLHGFEAVGEVDVLWYVDT